MEESTTRGNLTNITLFIYYITKLALRKKLLAVLSLNLLRYFQTQTSTFF